MRTGGSLFLGNLVGNPILATNLGEHKKRHGASVCCWLLSWRKLPPSVKSYRFKWPLQKKNSMFITDHWCLTLVHMFCKESLIQSLQLQTPSETVFGVVFWVCLHLRIEGMTGALGSGFHITSHITSRWFLYKAGRPGLGEAIDGPRWQMSKTCLGCMRSPLVM